MARYKTIREAAQAWVDGFSHIPRGICEKLIQADYDEMTEVTPPGVGDRVYIFRGKLDGESGQITSVKDDSGSGETLYTVELDSGKETIVSSDDFEVEHDDVLPMWGTLWAFSDSADNYWLENGGLQVMAECGFRIYEQEDYWYIFGIDGAGYSFLEEHWIPLYKARGLQWHEEEEDAE